jgi:hypothetical protein
MDRTDKLTVLYLKQNFSQWLQQYTNNMGVIWDKYSSKTYGHYQKLFLLFHKMFFIYCRISHSSVQKTVTYLCPILSNVAVHQIFTDVKRAYESAPREVCNNFWLILLHAWNLSA